MEDENKKGKAAFDNLTERLAGKSEVKQEVTEGVIKQSNFCEKEFFDAEILPLLEAISKKCKDRDIPLLLSVCFSRDDENAAVCSVGNLPGARTPVEFRLVTPVLKNENPLLCALLAAVMTGKKSDTDEK